MKPEGSVDVEFVGFGVRGFRGIRKSLFVPLGDKVTVLGGMNNSGKSAILAAALRNVPAGHFQNLRVEPLSGLDVPSTQDGASETDEFAIGLALRVGPDSAEADDLPTLFINALTGRTNSVPRDTEFHHQLRAALTGMPLQHGPSRSGVLWIWYSGGGGLAADFVAPLDAASPTNFHNTMAQWGASGEMAWNGYLRTLLQKAPAPTAVVCVPASRRIEAGGREHRTLKLPSFDGKGLTDFLLALRAPTAEEYWSATQILAKINLFLASVLEVPGAQLFVPHDAKTVHVAMHGQVLPLDRIGAGVEQLILLAAICTAHENALVMIEEPDLYLHPTLQRRFLQYLCDSTNNKYILATHSPVLLDSDLATIIRTDWRADVGTSAQVVSSPDARAHLALDLGFRASDLVQSNAVIWVEGPSDRIYIKRWLELLRPEFVEGIHYSFVIYGGRLVQHLTLAEGDSTQGEADEEIVEEFLEILRINRNFVMVMDSDITGAGEPLAPFKERLAGELGARNMVWITQGAMIENYLDPGVFQSAYASVHTKSAVPYQSGALDDHPFEGGVKQPNKVAIARQAAQDTREIADRGDLIARLREVVEVLEAANRGLRIVGSPENDRADEENPS